MQRQDTTARKWNASRPTYDEGWSDDELSEDEDRQQQPPATQTSVKTGIDKLTVRPPWEVAVDGASPTKASNTQTNTLEQNTSQEVRKENRQSLPSSSSVRKVSLEDAPFDSVRNFTQIQSNATPVDPGSSIASQPTQVTVDRASTEHRKSATIDAEPPLPELSSAQQLSSPQNVPKESAFDSAEDVRLSALMFSPEQLPYDQQSYADSDSGDEKPRESIADMYSNPEMDDTKTFQDSNDRSSMPVLVPSFPEDFKCELNARALSDGIMEAPSHLAKPADMERSLSDAVDDYDAVEVTTERTPSIMLSTNLWAQKNRLLKEQIEKNKKLQEKSASTVRASTYDVEYDYAKPRAMESPQTFQPAQQPDANLSSSRVENMTDGSNLRTLHEEDEEEEEIVHPRKPISRSATPNVVPVSRSVTPAVAPPLTKSVVSSPAIVATTHSTAQSNLPDPPQSAKSYDTNKSLPEIRAESRVSVSSDSGTDSDQESEHDEREGQVVSAAEEHALLKSLESRPAAADTNIATNKDLPPISQLEHHSPRNSLPPIATQIEPTESQAASTNIYTPSVYSAIPRLDDHSPERIAAATPASQPDRHSIRRSQGQADLVRAANAMSLESLHEIKPLTGTWESSQSKARHSQQFHDQNLELSRFSTSTIQTTDQDDYKFDDRDGFSPTMLEDKPYPDSDDENIASETETKAGGLAVPTSTMNTSASMATLQPPLRHMQSNLTVLSDASTELGMQREGPLESERLADELLEQLSGTRETRSNTNQNIDVTSTATATHDAFHPSASVPTAQLQVANRERAVISPDHSEVSTGPDQEMSVARMGTRGRTASAGSKFLEVITPGTSLEQARTTEQVRQGQQKMQSDELLRYKDIKNLPTAEQRIAEYRRRAAALAQSKSPLAEYLAAVQIQFEAQGRNLPGPAEHIELKSSKSIIPDKLIPNDLSRTTARLSDKGRDAAKGLISKSSKGLKGLFHSNSRSVSSTKKSNISLPLESTSGPSAPPAYQTQQTSSPIFRQNVIPPTTPQSVNNSQRYSPQHDYAAAPYPQQIASPLSQRATTPVQSRPQSLQPLPKSPASPSRPQSSTVSHIQSYFPDCSVAQIEAALAHCDGNEQSAIGYLVVNRQSPVR